MILVDTSVWVDHFRSGDDSLRAALELGEVCVHDFVIGELTCGYLPRRAEVLSSMQRLPAVSAVSRDEFLHFVEARDLMGRGMGFVDLQLLAAACMEPGLTLWTKDRRLHEAAEELGVGVSRP